MRSGSRNSQARSRVVPLKMDASLADELDAYVKQHGGNRNGFLNELIAQVVVLGNKPQPGDGTRRLPPVHRPTPSERAADVPLLTVSQEQAKRLPQQAPERRREPGEILPPEVTVTVIKCPHPAFARKVFGWGVQCGQCNEVVR